MPYRYFGPDNIAGKTISQLLSDDFDGGHLVFYDPYWQSPGVKMLHAGAPYINLASYCGISGSEQATTGTATGVVIDGQGGIGMFLNGFDTPSDFEPNGSVRGYGPSIQLAKWAFSPKVYQGPGSEQCLHMACRVELDAIWFDPPAGKEPGVGGQLGWRSTWRRSDGRDFVPGIAEFSILTGFWDSRNLYDPGFDGKDSAPDVTQGETWVSGTMAPGHDSKYVTRYGSTQMHGRSSRPVTDFYWNITRQNMLNALEVFGFADTTPEDVLLCMTSFGCEMYDNREHPAQYKPGQFGFNFTNMIVDIW